MHIKILSIDGGGTRGLFPATFLQHLENDLGQKATDLFDVIIGSATQYHWSLTATWLVINTPPQKYGLRKTI